MAGVEVASFESPTETREFEDGKGKLDLVELRSTSVGRAVFEPGWRWSEHVKPIAGTDSCQAAHVGYVVSGRMTVRMNDGTETTLEPGTVHDIPPGHDAWVVGDEPAVFVDWSGYTDYAKPK